MVKCLDIASSHYGPILISIVMSKLPDDIKLIVSRSMASVSTEESDKEWNIDELIRILKQEIESREMCYFVTNSSEKTGRPHKKDMPGTFMSSSLITAANKENPYSCVYCGKKHASWKCFTVTDVGSRKTILRKKGRCFLCLQSNHISRFCSTKYRCRKCKSKHNISICEPYRGKLGNELKQIISRDDAAQVSATVIRGTLT